MEGIINLSVNSLTFLISGSAWTFSCFYERHGFLFDDFKTIVQVWFGKACWESSWIIHLCACNYWEDIWDWQHNFISILQKKLLSINAKIYSFFLVLYIVLYLENGFNSQFPLGVWISCHHSFRLIALKSNLSLAVNYSGMSSSWLNRRLKDFLLNLTCNFNESSNINVILQIISLGTYIGKH